MAFYTVVNMVSGRKYGTFSNKKGLFINMCGNKIAEKAVKN